MTVTANAEGEISAMGPDPTNGAWGSSVTVILKAGRAAAPPLYVHSTGLSPTVLTATATNFTRATASLAVRPLVLADDFETGTLSVNDTPAGNWSGVLKNNPDSGISASPAAAHRGANGTRVIDGDTDPSVYSAVIFKFAPLGTDLFFLTWLRVPELTTLGRTKLALTGTAYGSGALLAWAGIDRPSGASQYDAVLSGDSNGTGNLERISLFRTGFSDGRWHLLEYAVTPTDWLARRIILGSAFTAATGFGMTGLYDFDDVRLSGTPAPSSLRLQDAGMLLLRTCNTLRVSLVDSVDGGEAAAPYDVPLSLTSSAGTFAGCPGAAVIRADQSFALVGFRPSSAAASVRLGDDGGDFLPGTGDGAGGELRRGRRPPTQEAQEGQRLTLNGAGSKAAADRAIAVYRWKQTDGPAFVEVGGEKAQTLLLSVPGRYVFELRVGDAADLSAPARAEVNLGGVIDGPPRKIGGCYCDSGSGSATLYFVAFAAALKLLSRRRAAGALLRAAPVPAAPGRAGLRPRRW